MRIRAKREALHPNGEVEKGGGMGGYLQKRGRKAAVEMMQELAERGKDKGKESRHEQEEERKGETERKKKIVDQTLKRELMEEV